MDVKIFTVWILCIYLLIMQVKVVKKYLIFDSTDENKELVKKYNDVWNGVRDKIKENKQWLVWLWKRLHEN